MGYIYTGCRELTLSDKEIEEFYKDRASISRQCAGLYQNQYLILKNENGEPFFYGRCDNEKIVEIQFPVIKSNYGTIKPRNPEQYCAIDLLKSRDIKVKVIRGVYGSGKDFLMLFEALSLIEKEVFQKIIYVRPPVTVANVPDIGFLPGDMVQKLYWTLGPIYDKVGGDAGIQCLIQQEKLEIAPLNYIRGRSFDNSIVYMSEGQNSTTEIMKLLLGRIGEGSELWINADTHQVDKKVFEADNGITRMVNVLRGNPLFGYIYLPTTERSEVARLADLLDEI